MAIFFNFSPTSSHLHPLQVENCGSNSRLVNSGSKGLKIDNDVNNKIVVNFTSFGKLFLKLMMFRLVVNHIDLPQQVETS